MLAAAVVGATAAAFSTAAAGDGVRTTAQAATLPLATAGQGPTAGVGGPLPLPAVAAEEPLTGRGSLSMAEATDRMSSIRAAGDAERRRVLLAEARRPRWALPMRPGTFRLTSAFSPRWGTFHYGLDLSAPYGTPIYAAGEGEVLRAGAASGFGNAVYLQHPTGDVTIYGHMRTVLVEPGERVKAGQLIALVGSEGFSTGPHLHFEVRTGGETGPPADPGEWLAKQGLRLL